MNTQSCTGSIRRMLNCRVLSLGFSQLFALALLLTLVREGEFVFVFYLLIVNQYSLWFVYRLNYNWPK